jgi:beta-mannosidase
VEKNRPNDRPRQFYEFGNYQATAATVAIWGTNSTLHPREVVLEVSFFDISPSSSLDKPSWTQTLEHTTYVLQPNSSTELVVLPVPAPPGTKGPDAAGALVVVSAVLWDTATDDVVARTADWPQPLLHSVFPYHDQGMDPGLVVEIDTMGQDQGFATITINARRPVKGLVLGAELLEVDDAAREGEVDGIREVKWSDNALDIVPGDTQTIVAHGLGKRGLTAAYLGREKAYLVAVTRK